MEANFNNIKKALELCAKAHNAEYQDWMSEGQFGIKSESIPVVSDVKMICRAFYEEDFMVEVDWGYTNVYLEDADFRKEVNIGLLEMALPFGWVEQIK